MRYNVLLAGLLAGGLLFLAGEAAEQPSHRNAGPFRANARQDVDWVKIQQQLKEKAPEEYSRIEELQKTNLLEAAAKLRELAEQSDLLPRRSRMERGERRGGEERPERGMMFGPRGGNSRAAIEAQLKQKYPEEYAKIEMLRRETETALEELAKKAGLELPAAPKSIAEQLETLKEKYPAEYAKIEELRKTDPRAAFRMTRELAEKAGITLEFGGPGFQRSPGSAENPAPGPARINPMQQMRRLKEKYPAEFAKIETLRRSDPAAARAQLRALLEKERTEQAQEPAEH